MNWYTIVRAWFTTLINLHRIGPRIDEVEDDLDNQIADLLDLVVDHIDPVPAAASIPLTPEEQATIEAVHRQSVAEAEKTAAAWYEKHRSVFEAEMVSDRELSQMRQVRVVGPAKAVGRYEVQRPEVIKGWVPPEEVGPNDGSV